MGLTEALLLDPYPFEIFVAVRTDGVKGSGTLNDPYDASTAARFDTIMKSLPAPHAYILGREPSKLMDTPTICRIHGKCALA